jgi:hypothetical protein
MLRYTNPSSGVRTPRQTEQPPDPHISSMSGSAPPHATHGNFFVAAARPSGGAIGFALLIHAARLDASVASDALPAGLGSGSMTARQA